jgi:hypothetical protein
LITPESYISAKYADLINNKTLSASLTWFKIDIKSLELTVSVINFVYKKKLFLLRNKKRFFLSFIEGLAPFVTHIK